MRRFEKIGLICIQCGLGMVEKAHLNPMMYLSTARHAALLLASPFGNDEPIVRLPTDRHR